MSKIFFYGNIKVFDKSSGITKKVLSQVEALRNMGHQVYYTGYSKEGLVVYDNDDKIVKEKRYSGKFQLINRVLRRWRLLKFAKNFINETTIHFDYSILRFHFFDHAYFKLLKSLKYKNTKTIVEAHSYPYRSFNILAPIYALDILYEPFVRNYIDLVAAITDHKQLWKCKTVQVENAIDLNEVKLKHNQQSNDGIIRLISVSNERYYHGYSKIIKGLSNYYNNDGKRKIEVFFVGEFKSSTKKIVEEEGMNNNIYFLGKKYGNELSDLYNQSDLGIGPLASRAGAEYGSSIKTKEYFAKGLPFITGWKEYFFDDSYPYVKRFNIKSKYIDFNEVIDFYDYLSNQPNVQEEMRRFAEENYTWEKQFNKIFNEFSKL